LPSARRASRRRFLKLTGWGAALGGASYAIFSNLVEITRHRLPLPGLNAELRALVLADAHLPSCFVDSETIRSVHRSFDPHVVFIVGDSVDERGNESLVEYFRDLRAPLGQFAVLGNWEYWGGCDTGLLAQAYARAGVRLLVNEAVTLHHAGGGIRTLGLDDLLGGRPDPGLLDLQESVTPTLVLAHCPGVFDLLPECSAVMLSGHTHGGQVAPFGLEIATPRGSGRYFRGWYRNGARRLYVTRGLGNSISPVRIGSRPEISLLVFVPTK
jgi:predicted MPP superfamily phosphohydrolase